MTNELFVFYYSIIVFYYFIPVELHNSEWMSNQRLHASFCCTPTNCKTILFHLFTGFYVPTGWPSKCAICTGTGQARFAFPHRANMHTNWLTFQASTFIRNHPSSWPTSFFSFETQIMLKTNCLRFCLHLTGYGVNENALFHENC